MLELTVLSNQDKEYLNNTAIEIKLIVKQTSQNIIDIGNKLKEVKTRVGHGHFLTWIKDNFEWSESQAYVFMKISDKFGKFDTYQTLNYGTNVLRLLSQDSTPQEAITEVVASPEIKTVNEVKEIIKKYKLIEPLQEQIDSGVIPFTAQKGLEKLDAETQMSIWIATNTVINTAKHEISGLKEQLY